MFEGFDKLDLSDTEVSGGSILEAGINHLTLKTLLIKTV